MKREQYLQGEVVSFTDWLAERLSGQSINFELPGYKNKYLTLNDALKAYRWPLRTVAGLSNQGKCCPYVHPAVPVLPARSNLQANSYVLGVIQAELCKAYNLRSSQSSYLAGAVAAVFHWGGVYRASRSGGNKLWLERNHLSILPILDAVVSDYARGDDCSTISDLRFNSGMTKVYSLLIKDFIIYDSRVAASLAWLALRWWTTAGERLADELPELLRFACLPGNGKSRNYRNPRKSVFHTISSRAHEHYLWNVRANWLLVAAQSKAGRDSEFGSLRDIEAALFQMGERVT